MDDELDSLVLRVRADTSAFARDVAVMRGELDGPLARGATNAGTAIEGALLRAARSGKFGFDDLKRTALAVLAEIAAASLRTNLGAQGGGGSSGGGGGLLSSLVSAGVSLLGGSPGRATGGAVVGGRPYVVGERGPELFVPGSAGVVQAAGRAARGAVNVTVNVAASGEGGARYMERTGRQVARAVRGALAKAD